jgi:hypothetical protein
LDGFIAVMYKKDHGLSLIKQLIDLLEEAKQLREKIANDHMSTIRDTKCSSDIG